MVSRIKCPNCGYIMTPDMGIRSHWNDLDLFEDIEDYSSAIDDGIYCPQCGDYVMVFELVVEEA